MGKIIQGARTIVGCRVSVTTTLGGVRELDPRFDLRNHSPAGFEWGYCGSGPAQLALAVLAEVTGDDQVALGLYQRYKADVVSNIHEDEWIIFESAVFNWINAIQLDRAKGQPNCN